MESAQEETNVHKTTIYPAAINTELPETNTDENMAQGMTILFEKLDISVDRVANIVAVAMDQPDDIKLNEVMIDPSKQSG